MVQYNADIGSRSNPWSHQELADIEEFFLKEHLPPQKRREYLKENLGDSQDVGFYSVVLKFDGVTACLGRDLDVLFITENPDQIEKEYDKLFNQLNTMFPKKKLRQGKLYQIYKFERMAKEEEKLKKEKQNDKKWYKKEPIIAAFIIGGLGLIVAIIKIFN